MCILTQHDWSLQNIIIMMKKKQLTKLTVFSENKLNIQQYAVKHMIYISYGLYYSREIKGWYVI